MNSDAYIAEIESLEEQIDDLNALCDLKDLRIEDLEVELSDAYKEIEYLQSQLSRYRRMQGNT